MKRGFSTATFVAMLLAVACSGSGGGGGSPAIPGSSPPATPKAGNGKKIQHIVIVIQENRTFDNFFATFPGAEGRTYAILRDGTKFNLLKAPLLGKELNHVHSGFVTEYDGGNMDGFNKIGFGSEGQDGPAGTYPLRYVDPSQIQQYWTMAKEYALADHMFQTQGSGSFSAHQELIAGGTEFAPQKSLIDFPSRGPWGCDAPTPGPNNNPPGTVTTYISPEGFFFNKGPFPCLKYATLADLLDPKGISWKYYVPPLLAPGSSGFLWNAFDAIHNVRYGPDWPNDVSPETTVFRDIAHNQLPAVSWVIPCGPNSDHAAGKDLGPSWVAGIVNAIGHSPYWNTTAIIVVWDDWGGYFDHVLPPQLDYQGLGFRVPMFVVSPYAKSGYVSHTQYEFGSIVKFVEQNWHLGTLHATDSRATNITDMFNFNQTPRPFKTIPSPKWQACSYNDVNSVAPDDE